MRPPLARFASPATASPLLTMSLELSNCCAICRFPRSHVTFFFCFFFSFFLSFSLSIFLSFFSFLFFSFLFFSFFFKKNISHHSIPPEPLLSPTFQISYLDSNQISYVSATAFQGMRLLGSLYLSSNAITGIAPTAFNTLTSLSYM